MELVQDTHENLKYYTIRRQGQSDADIYQYASLYAADERPQGKLVLIYAPSKPGNIGIFDFSKKEITLYPISDILSLTPLSPEFPAFLILSEELEFMAKYLKDDKLVDKANKLTLYRKYSMDYITEYLIRSAPKFNYDFLLDVTTNILKSYSLGVTNREYLQECRYLINKYPGIYLYSRNVFNNSDDFLTIPSYDKKIEDANTAFSYIHQEDTLIYPEKKLFSIVKGIQKEYFNLLPILRIFLFNNNLPNELLSEIIKERIRSFHPTATMKIVYFLIAFVKNENKQFKTVKDFKTGEEYKNYFFSEMGLNTQEPILTDRYYFDMVSK